MPQGRGGGGEISDIDGSEERLSRHDISSSGGTSKLAQAFAKLVDLLKEKLGSAVGGFFGSQKTLGGSKGLTARFARRYGAKHPIFFEGTYKQATEAALRANKFTLVFLTSEKGGKKSRADDAIARSFTDPAVISFINEHFILFAAAGPSPSGADAARRTGAKSLPYLGVIRTVAKDSKRALVGLHHCNPPPSAGGLVKWMSQLLEVKGGVLEADKTELARLAVEANLAKERQKGYAEAVMVDQKQIRKEKREAAAKAKEEAERLAAEAAAEAKARADAERRAAKAAALGDEPAAGAAAAAVEVALRLPDGRRERRRFLLSDDTERLYDWADVLGVELEASRLSRGGVRRGQEGAVDLAAEQGKTLEAAGLTGRVLVLVEARESGEGKKGGRRGRGEGGEGGVAAAPERGGDSAA
ncbi:hypothetical protein JKP88DRAFT_323161 [Tribonema minus]|uniref:UBX domain-containing protein n=1 Tax=Tribonema minus TaxID=303371 RepID=A0A835Z0S3_9STRA|nr:hypothetical protein JKP88DRAFT_323161 [Tribonema minus]